MGFDLSANGKVTGAEQIHQVFVFDSNASGDAGALPPDSEGRYDWIQIEADDPRLEQESRLLRLEAAKWSAATCLLGGYCINGEMPLLQVSDLINGTRLLRNVEGLGATRQAGKAKFVFHRSVSFSQVVLELAKNQQVSVLLAGNAYRVGGNFCTGGVVDVEEALCLQSTLHVSLRRAARLAEIMLLASPRGPRDQPKGWEPYIPKQGAVISPNVQIFRGAPENGFPFLKCPIDLAAVITIALPNRNALLADQPLDLDLLQDAKEYHKLVEANIAAGLEAAASRSRIVIIPELGCGLQQNDPKVVGSILASLLQTRFQSAFSEVHFVVGDAFRRSCSSLGPEALSGETASALRATSHAESSGQGLDAPSSFEVVQRSKWRLTDIQDSGGRRQSFPAASLPSATSTGERRHSSPPYASPITTAQGIVELELQGSESTVLESDGLSQLPGRRHSSPPYPSPSSASEVRSSNDGRRHSSPPYASPITTAQGIVELELRGSESTVLDSDGLNQLPGRRHSAPPYPSPRVASEVRSSTDGRRHSSPPYASPITTAQGIVELEFQGSESTVLDSDGLNQLPGRRHSSPPYPSPSWASEVRSSTDGRRHSSPPYASPFTTAPGITELESEVSESSESTVLDSDGLNQLPGRRHSSPPYPSPSSASEVRSSTDGRRHSSPPYASPITTAQGIVELELRGSESTVLDSDGLNQLPGRRHSSPPYPSPRVASEVRSSTDGRRHSSPPYASPITTAQGIVELELQGFDSTVLDSDGLNQLPGRRHSSPPYPSPRMASEVRSSNEGRRHSSPPYASPITTAPGITELESEVSESSDSTMLDSDGLNQLPGRRHSSPPYPSPSLASGVRSSTDGRRHSSPPNAEEPLLPQHQVESRGSSFDSSSTASFTDDARHGSRIQPRAENELGAAASSPRPKESREELMDRNSADATQWQRVPPAHASLGTDTLVGFELSCKHRMTCCRFFSLYTKSFLLFLGPWALCHSTLHHANCGLAQVLVWHFPIRFYKWTCMSMYE